MLRGFLLLSWGYGVMVDEKVREGQIAFAMIVNMMLIVLNKCA